MWRENTNSAFAAQTDVVEIFWVPIPHLILRTRNMRLNHFLAGGLSIASLFLSVLAGLYMLLQMVNKSLHKDF